MIYDIIMCVCVSVPAVTAQRLRKLTASIGLDFDSWISKLKLCSLVTLKAVS